MSAIEILREARKQLEVYQAELDANVIASRGNRLPMYVHEFALKCAERNRDVIAALDAVINAETSNSSATEKCTICGRPTNADMIAQEGICVHCYAVLTALDEDFGQE